MLNPFKFGRELGSDELVDRDEDVSAVVQTIFEGGKLFLIGPRRYGKTSILKVASERATLRRASVLRYNAEGYPTLDLMVSAIIADAARSLKGGVERAGQLIRQLFAKLRPELSFSVSESSWNVKLGAGIAEPRSQMRLLVDALNALEKMATNQIQDRPLGLILDEFQKVIEDGGGDAEAQIRAAIQSHKHVGYVFAGSKKKGSRGRSIRARAQSPIPSGNYRLRQGAGNDEAFPHGTGIPRHTAGRRIPGRGSISLRGSVPRRMGAILRRQALSRDPC